MQQQQQVFRQILAGFLLWTAVAGLGYPQPAESQPREQIPVLAWYGVSPEASAVERYIELRESGITHNLTFFSTEDELAVALDAAEKAGIKMFAACPELQSDPEKTANRFKDHPALAGYHLADEPGRASFPMLGEWARKIQAVDDKHCCYVNLFPNYAPLWALGTESYREHVRLSIEEVPTPFVSFDYYPVVEEGAAPDKRILRGTWYENLEVVSDESRKAGKPFWAFALTVAHGPYPIPTPAELRLQVYSNLVYGAQGIQYFTYWTPNPETAGYDFHHGPIDFETAKRTEVYDDIKEMNREIKNLSRVFLNAKVVSIAHTGGMIPQGTQRLEKLPDGITTLEFEGEGAIVSVLEKEGKSYLVLVNRDFKNTMKVTIEGEPGLLRVLKDGTMVPASVYISTMTVAPGDILIYCRENQ
ncbi:MAG: beta-galactosidase [Planctomycetaceae bacterium]|nr:beta-galactosidase [Planctomycetaceae bacterium]